MRIRILMQLRNFPKLTEAHVLAADV